MAMDGVLVKVNHDFRKKSELYYSNVSPTVESMTGIENINSIDIQASSVFLHAIFKLKNPPKRNYALDCGAGIGRVSKYLLMPMFNKVDMVERDRNLIDHAKSFLGANQLIRLGTIYNVGLENFQPDDNKQYDVIWIQLVLGYLMDDDLVHFLKNCLKCLAKDGIIVIKDNVSPNKEYFIRDKDALLTRPLNVMKNIITQPNLKIIRIEQQMNLPHNLYPVFMIALRPRNNKSQ